MFRRCIPCRYDICHGKDQQKRSQTSDEASTSSDEDDFGLIRRRSDLTISPTTERFVLEIIGAMGLSVLANDVDSFCIVSRVATDGKSKVCHRTKTINSDTAPIWTLKTKSICFVELDKSQTGERIKIELCRKIMRLPGMNSRSVVGTVELTYSILLANGDSKRREYPVSPEEYPGILLALRFRKATPHDWNTFQELQAGQSMNAINEDIKLIDPKHPRAGNGSIISFPTLHREGPDHAGDVDFEFVSQKGILGNVTTVIENGIRQKAYRVWPFADPENIAETTYMTKTQLQQRATEPSRMWVEAGSGAGDNYGSIFLEVLGCDGLPNMVRTRFHELYGVVSVLVGFTHDDGVSCYVRGQSSGHGNRRRFDRCVCCLRL